jgi:hypothetical protein
MSFTAVALKYNLTGDLQSAVLQILALLQIPPNTQTGNWSIVPTDYGSLLRLAGTTAQTVTIPLNSVTQIGECFIMNVCNVGTDPATISTTGTLYAPGIGTGNRTLASPGMCTIFKTQDTDEWFITGVGLS